MLIMIKKLVHLTLGMFIAALGVVITYQAKIGYAPYEVLHSGLSKIVGLPVGTVSIIVGFLIVITDYALGERIGIGTILNMVLIGMFMNILMYSGVIPEAPSLLLGIVWVIVGSLILAIGTYIYLKEGMCAGPKDGLMAAFTRLSHLPAGLCRTILEGSATVIGYFLGGSIGIGTVICSIAIGFCIQLVFSIMKFDTSKIKHEDLFATAKNAYKFFCHAK